MDRIVEINVSGRVYQISCQLIENFPNSTLAKKCRSNLNEAQPIFIERPLPAFESVLEYYQTGSLHAPKSRCYASFVDELSYWGFKESDISVCCQRKLASFRSDQKDMDKYEKEERRTRRQYEENKNFGSCVSSEVRSKIWNWLDNFNYDIVSKMIFLVSIMVVLICLTVSVLISHEEFDIPLQDIHWEEYFEDDDGDFKNAVETLRLYKSGNITRENLSDYNVTEALIDRLYSVRRVRPIFTYIMHFCTGYFTFEQIVRLCFCPSYKRYFLSILNLVDVVTLLLDYLEIFINALHPKQIYESNILDIIQFLQILRVLRLFRITRHISGARVLIFTIKNSVKELLFMIVLLANVAILFGTLFYCLDKEASKNITQGTWWAVITMTTVGYGDVVPNGILGRVLGIACAAFGIVLIALTVPLFVNNFFTIYNVSIAHEFLNVDKQQGNSRIKPVKLQTIDHNGILHV